MNRQQLPGYVLLVALWALGGLAVACQGRVSGGMADGRDAGEGSDAGPSGGDPADLDEEPGDGGDPARDGDAAPAGDDGQGGEPDGDGGVFGDDGGDLGDRDEDGDGGNDGGDAGLDGADDGGAADGGDPSDPVYDHGDAIWSFLTTRMTGSQRETWNAYDWSAAGSGGRLRHALEASGCTLWSSQPYPTGIRNAYPRLEADRSLLAIVFADAPDAINPADGHCQIDVSGFPSDPPNCVIPNSGCWGDYQSSTGRIHIQKGTRYRLHFDLWVPAEFETWANQPRQLDSNGFSSYILVALTSRLAAYPEEAQAFGIDPATAFLPSMIYIDISPIYPGAGVAYLDVRYGSYFDYAGGAGALPPDGNNGLEFISLTGRYERWLPVELEFVFDNDSADGLDGEIRFRVDGTLVVERTGILLGNYQRGTSSGPPWPGNPDFTAHFRFGLYNTGHVAGLQLPGGGYDNPDSVHDIWVKYRDIAIFAEACR